MGAAQQLIDRIRHWCRGLFSPRAIDRQMDEELQSWIRELAARHMARGVPSAEAERRARIEIGNMAALKDEVRDGRAGAGMRAFGPDLRDAWRSLVRRPWPAAAMIVTFALGIGATTAIFSVVNAMLIAPLPYRNPSALAIVWSDMTSAGYPRAPLSGPELADLRARSAAFESFGAIWATSSTLTEGEPEQLRTGAVTTNFFDVLGAAPALGRTFSTDDDAQTSSPGVVLSWALFERRFGADPSIVGRTIQTTTRPLRVIGVMPKTFRLLFPADSAVPDDLQAFTSVRAAGLIRAPRGQQYLRVIGRMKPGVSIADARQDVSNVAAAISREFSEYGAEGRVFTTVGLQADDVREIRPALLVLGAGVAILLLIACVNVAGLLVARAAGRSRETAVRMALGADRRRLFRLHAAEGLLVTSAGAIVGLGAGWVGLRVLLHWRPASLARIDAAGLDLNVLALTAAVTLGWALLLSLAPLSESLRANVLAVLRRTGERGGTSSGLRTRTWLVAAQMALSLTLLIGAGLLVRTFINVERRDLGFATEGRLTFRIAVPFQRYGSAAGVAGFSRDLMGRLRGLPDVSAVGAISHLPFDDLPNWGGGYVPDTAPVRDSPMADYRAVTPEFFDAAGARLIAGRDFSESDAAGSPLVVVVDDLLAARAWPGQSAIGHHVLVDPGSNGTPGVSAEVVGVVNHLRLRSLVEPLADQVYFSARQVLRSPMAYVVRTSNVGATSAAVRGVASSLDPLLPVFDARPLATYVRDAQAGRRFMALLVACFAAVAVALSSIGLFGVVAYTVTGRRREFGVRLALGATSRQIGWLVARQGAAIAAAGLAAGVALALPAAAAIRGQLVGVSPFDPLTIGAGIALVLTFTAIASWFPARRAARTSPSESLRND